MEHEELLDDFAQIMEVKYNVRVTHEFSMDHMTGKNLVRIGIQSNAVPMIKLYVMFERQALSDISWMDRVERMFIPSYMKALEEKINAE